METNAGVGAGGEVGGHHGERRLSFDLRDFDETLPGPFEWDVSRLVASVVVLARESGLGASVAEEAVARCLETYRDRISRYADARQLDIWYDLISAERFVALFAPVEQEQVASLVERKARRLFGRMLRVG